MFVTEFSGCSVFLAVTVMRPIFDHAILGHVPTLPFQRNRTEKQAQVEYTASLTVSLSLDDFTLDYRA